MRKFIAQIIFIVVVVSLMASPVLYGEGKLNNIEEKWNEDTSEEHRIELLVEDYGDEVP